VTLGLRDARVELVFLAFVALVQGQLGEGLKVLQLGAQLHPRLHELLGLRDLLHVLLGGVRVIPESGLAGGPLHLG